MKNLENYKTKIETDRFVLRVLEETDASEKYVSWLKDPIVNQYLETRDTTLAELKNYIKEKNESPGCLFFGIFDKENNNHIGNVKLEPIDFAKSCATMGIIIGERNYWGKGVATEVVKAIVSFAFEYLGIKEVNLGVISENKAAIKVYEKSGFEIYKTDKQALDHNGKKFDQVWMKKQK